ncbi:hypothetical protein LCGC14_3070890, partial [marine sediment metagenome]
MTVGRKPDHLLETAMTLLNFK